MQIIKKLKGFTLVELIIVITILAILATIAFVSFQSYTKDSRNSNRLTTIKNIETWLQAFQITTGSYPEPDAAVEIYNSKIWMWSGMSIGKQGIIWDTLVKNIRINTIPVDPLDKKEFMYYKSLNGLKYQILSYLEKGGISYSNDVYADNESQRNIKSFWSELGVIFDTNNNAIIWSGGKFDVFWTWNTTFNILRTKMETVTVSGAFLYLNSYANTSTWWTQCNEPDFLVYGPNGTVYVLASCNMWASKAWDNSMSYTGSTPIATSNYITNKHYEFLWNYYQWGRNDPVWVVNEVKLFVESGPIKYNWVYKTSWVQLSGSGFITGTGSLYATWIDNVSHESSKEITWEKWPCPEGYKIPTSQNYSDIMYSLVNKKDYCVWCIDEITFLQNSLKMPKSWSLEWTAGSYWWYGTRGLYWTAEPGTNGGAKFFDITYSVYNYVLWAGTAVRSRWFPIRCFKD